MTHEQIKLAFTDPAMFARAYWESIDGQPNYDIMDMQSRFGILISALKACAAYFPDADSNS